MPTPTIPGGHGLPPAPTIDSSTNCLIPFTPSAGTHIFRKLMFSEPEPLGTHLTSRPSQSGDELPVDDRQTVARVRPGVLARERVDGVRAQRMLDRRALGAGLERVVDPRGMQREVLADAARVDGDARVLADEVLLRVGDLDVPQDRARARAGRARRSRALGRGRERVAQVLRDVLQRPDVEVRGRVLDGAVEVGVDRRRHARALLRGGPARRGARRRSTRAGCCPSSGCGRACRPRSRRRRRGPRASSGRRCR